jgi:sortase A
MATDGEEQGDARTTPAARPPKASGGRRWARRLGDVLLIAGGLVLAYPFWSAGYAQVQQARLASAYREQSNAFATALKAAAGTRVHVLPESEVVRRLAVLYGRRLERGDPIGRLTISRIHLNRLVQQGTAGRRALDPTGDHDLLRSGPVHYAVTPLPGAGEPFAVAGHRTTYGAPFNRLDKLKRGDVILLETPYAKFRYSVSKTTVVKPDDVSVLLDRGYGLVLTTCTPLYSASHRLIVWASLDSATPLDKARSARL